jgi:hypothetical protein
MRHLLFATLIAVTVGFFFPDKPTARCTTDTDCARLCDPDDDECDGGPQPASYWRA